MDMQRYRWPGYEIQLLGELQRQQNNSQFCDTLLQTEGISVPTHSCILAALSPYLSQKLTSSPSPPSGQRRQLQLQAVKAQTLLKLVGLLYSGEVEVKGGIEQSDLLSAALQFGITDLIEGHKDVGMKKGEPQKKSFGSCRESYESRKMQDAQIQAEMAERRASDSPIEKRSCASKGTQTVNAGEKTMGRSFAHSSQSKPPAAEPASSVAQSLDFSLMLQPQNVTLDRHFHSSCFPPISSMPSRTPSDVSTLAQSSDTVTNPTSTSACFSNVMSFHSSYQQSSEVWDRIGTGLEDEKTNVKTADRRENSEQPSHANRDEMPGESKGNSIEKKHAHATVGMKNLSKMKMMETTQISVKVKLRRRTKGVWEVVSIQDTDETLSVLTSLKQTDLTNSEPSSVQAGPVHKPETPILQPATTNSPEPPPHPGATFDSQLLCSDCFSPNQIHDLESVPQPQPPGPGEESDELIEKLLEDVMMGLNILPSLERDCKKSHHLQPSHDGAPASCQVPVTESDRPQSQMHVAVTAAGGVCYQDFATQVGHSSTDTAQNQPSCSSLSSVQSDAVLLLQQQQCYSSMGQGDGNSYQGMPPSKHQNCPYPEASATRSVMPPAFCSSGQKLHYPACQEPFSHADQNIHEFLPPANGNEAPSFSSPCMDDLRLPRCLSPLKPFASAAKYQPIPNNCNSKILPQSSLHGRPWLAENTGSLIFPLSAIASREIKSASLPQDTNHSCWAESNTVKKGGVVSTGDQDAAEVKPDHRELKESFICTQGDTKRDAAVPKKRNRKRTSHPQDTAGTLVADKDVKASDATKSQINLSVCSVTLSSNSVLEKAIKMATSSSNKPNTFLGKPDEPSTITAGLREKTRCAGDLSTDQTRIRTRSILKNTQETPINTSLEQYSVLKPMACRAKIVDERGVSAPRWKRGRPLKTKLEESPPAVSESKSHGVKSEQQTDYSLPKEEEGEKTESQCKKRRRSRSEVEVIPLKKTMSAESTGKAEADDNNEGIIPAEGELVTLKRPRMVTLKDFKKLIKHQNSKVMESKESQDKETTAREVTDAESEAKACGSRCGGVMKDTDMNTDIPQPQNRDGMEDSHVIFNVIFDKNNNQIFNKSTAECSKPQRGDTNSSTSEESSLSGDERRRPGRSFGVLGEEVAKSAAEREQSLKSPDEAQKACDAGVSDTTQQSAVTEEASSHRDTHTPPQDNKKPLDYSLNPQTPERTGPPLSNAGGFIKNSDCDQEEEDEEDEEEEEEVEVDILCYSPDKVPQSRECENGLNNMDITAEDEEEEDMNEIDVTGDEAE